jgi:arylformamidase
MLDISVPIQPGVTPQWPGAPKVRFDRGLSIEDGDAVDDTTLLLNIHTGTHIDAPSHFVAGAKTVDQVPLSRLIGPCEVVALPGVERIGASELAAAQIPEGTTRVLLKTDNEQKWSPEFDEDFVGLRPDGARWLVDRGIVLVGIDYLSVQPFHESNEVHHTLLTAEVVIVEGLDLSAASAGAYELVCLPLKLHGVEGAPARALLFPPGTNLGGQE